MLSERTALNFKEDMFNLFFEESLRQTEIHTGVVDGSTYIMRCKIAWNQLLPLHDGTYLVENAFLFNFIFQVLRKNNHRFIRCKLPYCTSASTPPNEVKAEIVRPRPGK